MIKGILLAISAGICWGLSGVAGECLMKSGDITSEWLVPVRLISAGIILMIYQIFRLKKHIFDVFKRKKDVFDLIVYALLGIMMCQYTYFFTIERSNAGTATVLQYISPVIVMIIACINQKRLPNRVESICLIMSLGGVFLLATHGNFDTLAISPSALVSGLASAVTVVIYTLVPVNLLKKYSPLYLLSWAFIIGGCALGFVFRVWENIPVLNIEKVLLISVTSVVGSIFGYGLYLAGLRLIGSTRACLVGSMEPVSAAVFSWLFMGTYFSAIDIIGFALIISTVILLTVDKNSVA